MIYGIRFPVFRLTILILTVLAQVYLYARLRGAIRSSRASDRAKRLAIGMAGGVIGLLFSLNTYLLFRPLPWVDPPQAVQIGLFYSAAAWHLGSLVSAVLLFLARLTSALNRIVLRPRRTHGAQTALAPVNPGRRRLLQVGVGSLAAGPILLSGYGAAYAGKRYDIQALDLPFGHPLRVVQLTDIHAGIYMTRTDIRRIADEVAGLRPDLFVLTGDFISNSMAFLPGCLEEVARVQAPFGTFATLGNHEHMHGRRRDFASMFWDHRIVLLTNAHRIIQTERGRFAVAGIDDLRRGFPDLAKAVEGLDPALPTLLLSHRPEIFPDAARRGIRLTLAGHYHGGQIKLSLPGQDVSLAHVQSPYPEGLYRIGESRLYVSRGVGTTFTPVRLNAPPEITLFRLA